MRIALSFRATAADDGSAEQPLLLKSKETEILAFQRMSRADFSVSWEIESIDDDDDYDGEYDDVEEDNDSDEVYAEEDGNSDNSSEADEEEDDHNENEADDD